MRWTRGNAGAGFDAADCPEDCGSTSSAVHRQGRGPTSSIEQEFPSNKAYCIKSFDQTEDEVTRQMAGHKDAIENNKDQLCCKDAHIEAVRKSIPELDESVTKMTEVRQK